MNLSNERKGFIIFLLIVVIIITVFSFALFGFTGIRIIFGIIFVSFPFYLILGNFELTDTEKFIFSILLGLTIFSSLVYILGLVISFRIAIILTFMILVIAAIAYRYTKKQRK